MRFLERVVLVTGAASGIGRSTTEAFVAEVRTSSPSTSIETVWQPSRKSSLALKGKYGPTLGTWPTRRLSRQRRGCCRAARSYRCTVQYRGLSELGHLVDFTFEQWQRIIAVNLSGTFLMTQAAMPHLLESGGNVVNMGSVAGLVGNPYNSIYCASKGGVVNLTRALAIEFSKRGVRVNCVCPGSVITPATARTQIPSNIDDELFGYLTPPMGHTQPEVIADAILYLASDAARYTTGVALPVDGGRTAV